MKALVAEQLGFTALSTEKIMGRYAHEGELHEVDVQNRLAALDRQKEVTLDLLPSARIVGHIDGIVGDSVLEVKSMGDVPFKQFKETGWDTEGLVQKYKWQISIYMLAEGKPCWFVAKNRNSGEWLEMAIDEPFYNKQEILMRLVEIEKWVRRGELPGACSVVQFPCSYYYLHEQESLELTEDDVIDELARMYKDAQIAVKAAEARKVEARKALDTGLAGREKVITGKSRVVYYEAKSEKIDYVKMAEDGVRVNDYKVAVIGKRLRVTVKDDDDAVEEVREDELRGDVTREAVD